MNKQVSAILCADLHLREDTPICRTDDYKAAQQKKLEWLHHLAATHRCPILCAGDVFDNWDISAEMATWVIETVPTLWAIPGQHDLPSHNLELIKKSGYGVLQASHIIDTHLTSIYKENDFIVEKFPFGKILHRSVSPKELNVPKVALIHTLVLGPKDDKMEGSTVQEIFDKMPRFDLILCGDNHKAFTVKQGDRLFVSPGSMMRMSADQADFKPRVYLWYADTNEVEPAYYPIEEGVITREHIDKKEVKTGMLDAFVQIAGARASVVASFEQNMVEHLQVAKVNKSVEEKIYEVMGK